MPETFCITVGRLIILSMLERDWRPTALGNTTSTMAEIPQGLRNRHYGTQCLFLNFPVYPANVKVRTFAYWARGKQLEAIPNRETNRLHR